MDNPLKLFKIVSIDRLYTTHVNPYSILRSAGASFNDSLHEKDSNAAAKKTRNNFIGELLSS